MKVLISAYACVPNEGREESYGWNYANELAKLGYELWVLTPLWNQTKIQQALAAGEVIPNLHFVYVDHPDWIKRLMRQVFHRETSNYHYLVWQHTAYQTAIELEQEQNFDLVHHLTMGSLVCGSWLWRLNKPFILGPAGGGQVAPHAFRKYIHRGWRLELIRTAITNQLIPRLPALKATVEKTSLILASNQDTVHLAERLGATRAELFLDTGLPEDYFPATLPVRSPTQELRLLWIGRLYPRKSILLALSALAQINPAMPYKLTILGSGPQDDCLSHWLQEFKLEHRVEWLGQVPWQEVKNKYLESDIFLFTSLRDTFGAQLLEAMAHALPIICLDHQGARSFVPSTAGIKVPVEHPAQVITALAQAIELMYKEPQQRLEMGKAGYNYAKTHTWEQHASDMANYYQEVLKKQQNHLDEHESESLKPMLLK
jgi:glycosyltransferase involved in cell wall biosynthesis